MGTRKTGTGWRDDLIALINDEDENLVDDEPEDGFELIDDQDEKPDDRRRDPLRRPI
jgi:hypothetical protein